MLLIYPPLAKPCEPPAGIAHLAGALRENDIPCTLLDANIEGLLFLLEAAVEPADTWGRRAYKSLKANLTGLRSRELYTNRDRYRRAVADVNRVLEFVGQKDTGRGGCGTRRVVPRQPVRRRYCLVDGAFTGPRVRRLL